MNANRIFSLKLFRIIHHRDSRFARFYKYTNILKLGNTNIVFSKWHIGYPTRSNYRNLSQQKEERKEERKRGGRRKKKQGERFRLYRAFLNEIIENAETPRKLRCSRPRWDETRLMPGNWANFGKRQPETFAREKRQRERQGEGVVRHGTGPNFARSRVKFSKR